VDFVSSLSFYRLRHPGNVDLEDDQKPVIDRWKFGREVGWGASSGPATTHFKKNVFCNTEKLYCAGVTRVTQ